MKKNVGGNANLRLKMIEKHENLTEMFFNERNAQVDARDGTKLLYRKRKE